MNERIPEGNADLSNAESAAPQLGDGGAPPERGSVREALQSALKKHGHEDLATKREAKEIAPPRDRQQPDRHPDGKFAPTSPQAKAPELKPDRAPAAGSPGTQNSAATEAATTPSTSPQATAERPASWAADKATLWSSLPPDAQAYVAKREADISKGFAEYGKHRERLTEIDQALAPVRPLLQQLGQSDAAAIQKMALWHQALSGPQRREAFVALAQQVGLDLSTLVPSPGSNQNAQQQPQFAAELQPVLNRMLEPIQQELSTYRQAQQQERLNRANADISKFAEGRGHFDRVRTKMASLIASQQATSLEDAYDQAVWSDPAIRTELLTAEQEKRQAALVAAQEADRQKLAAAEEDRRKREAEAAQKARRAGSVSPHSATPGKAATPTKRAAGTSSESSVRGAIRQAIREKGGAQA